MFARLALSAALLASAVPAAAQDGTRVIHSPWLAVKFEQAGAEAPLRTAELLVTEVALDKAPFTIILPVRGEDDEYALAGWSDASIFALARSDTRAGPERAVGTPFYFAQYTGMADTAASSGGLWLNLEGHHFLSGLRLGPDRGRHVFHVSEITKVGANTFPIEEVGDALHLVIWFDEDGDGAMAHGEYEFFTLNFGED